MFSMTCMGPSMIMNILISLSVEKLVAETRD